MQPHIRVSCVLEICNLDDDIYSLLKPVAWCDRVSQVEAWMLMHSQFACLLLMVVSVLWLRVMPRTWDSTGSVLEP